MRSILDIYRKIIYGAGHDILKPKKKSGIIKYFFDYIDYSVFKIFDWIDTKILFGNRRIRTRKGRVRSFAERRLVKFFERNNIEYIYEKKLIIEGHTVYPDFYLSEYDVYVEFWGMVNVSERYKRIMQFKKRKYREYQIRVISIYPTDFYGLDKIFRKRFKKATGKEFELNLN
ncbi:MAG: hypothetical protein ABH956_01990 [Candidatus Nealsonbacteria bacterium]